MEQSALDVLVAKEHIRELVLLYSRGVDRKDFDLVRSLYTRDATDTHGPKHYADMDAFMGALRRALPTQRNGGHYVCNHLITVNGDRAEGEVYVLAFHLVQDAAGQWIEELFRVRYADDYRIEEGRWRFASRVVVFDDVSTRPAPTPQGDAPDQAADLSYALNSRIFARGTRG